MLRRDNAGAIGIMLASVAAFSLMDAGLKRLAGHYPALQVATLRGLASLPPILLWIATTSGFATVLRVRWPLHLLRGGLSVMMIGCFAFGLRDLSLSTAYTLFFVAPLLVTALSVPLLGERVEWQRWLAILVGLLGTLVVLRPSTRGMMTLAGFGVLAAAAGYAGSAIAVRVLSRTDSTQSMVFWMLVMLSLGAGLLAAPDWQPIRREDFGVIGAIGVCGSIGQYAITRAFSMASPSVVAPFEYFALLWGMGLDWVFWRAWPDAWTFVGAAIIVASGLYLIHRERSPTVVMTP
jgi:drug/metabolite transporter (DMT)-like permease